MKCDNCLHCYFCPPIQSSPYGEFACLITGDDLRLTQPEDVENCISYVDVNAAPEED